MATKKKTTTSKVAEAPVSAPEEEVKEPAKEISQGDELVAEAAIDIVAEEADEVPAEEEVKEPEPEEVEKTPAEEAPVSSETVIINTSYNEILLNTGRPGASIRIAPKEIKSVSRALLRELLQNKIVRRWFDKGILTSNQDANEADVNEAVAPEHLRAPVERTDSVSTISASVTKFKKDGNVQIKL